MNLRGQRMPRRCVLSGLFALLATIGAVGYAADKVKVPPVVNPVVNEGRVDEYRVEDSRWTRTLERIASGVVTIQIDQTRAFDTEWNSSGQATGFVVRDKLKRAIEKSKTRLLLLLL